MKTGLENFVSRAHKKYQGARVGFLCNQASVDSKLTHLSDLVMDKKLGLNVTCFFGPQHGIRGEKQDNMVESDHFRDKRSGLVVWSLYGETRVPTEQMYKDLDVLVVDLQDVGTRIYTFMYTLANCMRQAKALGKKIVVLDRPNPIDGVTLEGNTLEEGFTSFVGQFPLATRHGMTMGELATLFNDAFGIGCDLDVIPITGWKRAETTDSWGRDWVPPSPNVPVPTSVLTFPGTVHFEGTNVSEGRGTAKPFEWIGAPFVDPDTLGEAMAKQDHPGVVFRPIYFQPTYQKCAGEVCGGVQIHVTHPRRYRPFESGLSLLATIAKLFPKGFEWKTPPYEYEFEKMPIDLIAGTDQLRNLIDAGKPLTPFFKRAETDLVEFKKLRKNYLMYPAR